jgi:tetratricopeptide (TPR) repeat protein
MEAVTLHNIGHVYQKLGEKQKALEYYNQSLPLIRALGARAEEATALKNIGNIYLELGEKQKALESYNQSLILTRFVGDRRGEALALHNIGYIYSNLGEKQKAVEYYSQSLPVSRAVGDSEQEFNTLYNRAYAKYEQNNFTEALNDIEASIKIIENLRTEIASPELRTSYFTILQNHYQFYIYLLMHLHKTSPNSGYDIKASEASERARNP